MRTCPNCQQLGISTSSLSRAALWGKAVCGKCGKPSTISPTLSGLLGVAQTFLTVYFIYLAYINQTWLYIGALALVWAGLEVLAILLGSLVPAKIKKDIWGQSKNRNKDV